MKRALPVLVLSVAALVPVWRYAPSIGASTESAGSATAAPPPAPSSDSSAPPTSSSGAQVIAGSTVPTEKGDVQVEVTLTAGRITAVRTLKQPDHPQTTEAVPKLIEATLEAQSADIDTVSGATITSDGYRESLQAALDRKRA
ncbi:FMN-binding protein [Streptomyces lasiicapitis]|uniref:FMN-binding protein n=1 Tax=Streptomyces lasiicapitis TaxID=1923961 RepID=UPI00366239CD